MTPATLVLLVVLPNGNTLPVIDSTKPSLEQCEQAAGWINWAHRERHGSYVWRAFCLEHKGGDDEHHPTRR